MHLNYSNPLITVIIPVYNAEKLIASCIESIIQQTVDYWNIILINDGSTDRSKEICQNFAIIDNRITLINQPNGGPGKARNTGIEACKTPWFTFIDADDKILPTYLENFHVEACEYSTVLSCQGFKRIDLKGNPLGESFSFKDFIYSGKDFMDRAFREENLYSYGQSVGKLYNKSICDKHSIRLKTDIKWSEDHIFYLNYLLWVKEIHTHSGCLYLYQLNPGQESLTHRNLPYIEALLIFRYLYPAADEVVQKFKLESQMVINKINYHSVTACYSNILQNLYRERPNINSRIAILKELRISILKVHNKYKPHGKKARLLKPMLMYLPLFFLDLILSIIIHKQ